MHTAMLSFASGQHSSQATDRPSCESSELGNPTTTDPTQSLGKANSLAATFSLACSSASWPGYLHKHDNDNHRMLMRKIMLM